ncbi:MAG: hypothetical protein ISQ17_00450 [Pelagibacteraceae bacterium]|jgi:hypothetical protein|nr:hypothetical protein [Pelagibacteraceae bacterium]
MKKLNILIIFFSTLLLLTSCGSSGYKIKKFKNEIPKWYIEEKKQNNFLYGKASADSQSIELANRKATGLAIGSLLLKIRNNSTVIAEQFLNESDTITNKKMGQISKDSSYQEKITQAVRNFEVNNYEVVNREIFRDQTYYKVFIELKINKKDLYEYLNKNQ